MACYFCRDTTHSLVVHDKCKDKLQIFENQTLCTQCGKCDKCNADELTEIINKQKYGIIQLSTRRYGIVHITHRISLGIVTFNDNRYLGPHYELTFVEGYEKLDYATAKQALYDLLYGEHK